MSNFNNVINFHFTDLCNYHCYFCFVEKDNRQLSLEQCKVIVNKIKLYFDNNHIRGRINLAGGEPLCSPFIQDLINYIYSLEIEVSLITNGYLLTEGFIFRNKDKLSMIGISVDSVNPALNVSLGRCTNKNYMLTWPRLINLCKAIKANNIKLKINLCVSRVNIEEDIKDIIKIINPDRFKIFQVVPENEFSKKVQITQKEYFNYLKKYEGINFISETSEFMNDHYLIIDSEGNVSRNNTHTSKMSLLENHSIEEFLNNEK